MIQSVSSTSLPATVQLAATGEAIPGGSEETAEMLDFSALLSQQSAASDALGPAPAMAVPASLSEQQFAGLAAEPGKILPQALQDDTAVESLQDKVGAGIPVIAATLAVPVASALPAEPQPAAKASEIEDKPAAERPMPPQLPATASQTAVAALLRRHARQEAHDLRADKPHQFGPAAIEAASDPLPIEPASHPRKAAKTAPPVEEVQFDLARLAPVAPRAEQRSPLEKALPGSTAIEAAAASQQQPSGITSPLGPLHAIPAAPQAVRPHEFAALIDRLTAAREAAVPQGVAITVAHQDFGPVRLRFRSEDSGLSVAMSSSDPGFARAAAAAPLPVLPTTTTEQAGLSHQRGDGGQAQSGGSGNSGRGATPERRDGYPQPGHVPALERLADRADGHRGIFA
jgi:hypothetical protein